MISIQTLSSLRFEIRSAVSSYYFLAFSVYYTSRYLKIGHAACPPTVARADLPLYLSCNSALLSIAIEQGFFKGNLQMQVILGDTILRLNL